MDFYAILDQAVDLLRRHQRVTYRALQRQFDLDDAALEDLKEALLFAHPQIADEAGRGLVWTEDTATASVPISSPAPAPVRAPLTYTPSYLAEKILTSRSALEGERKQVTVLFADLKGSMELLADRDPEEARQLLDPVLERMMAAVHRYEGTVNQVMGDGIMALFGAPLAHEDHAIRACYAALAMQAAIRTYAEAARRAHGITVQMRVGLHSGAVVVRAIGNDLHMDYSAVGQTTHLAARMEQLATPGSILLTADTLRLVEGLVQVTALGPLPVKGLPEPVEVFELVGASALRGRFQARVAGGLTRFVGRETERAALVQALERAGAGHGQVVAVVGEAGVGKSRLVYECVHAHHLQGWRVLESASVSYGKATPYFPVIDLLRRYTHIEERDDVRTIQAKVTGQVLTLDETLQETIPALLFLLDALPEDSPFRTLDPPHRRQRTLDACKRVLLRESQVQPVLFVCEDLHWIDTETQALLESLVESLPTVRLLLLVNYRPEYRHGWGSKTYYTQLRLDPLPPASAEALLQVLLGDDPSLAPLQRLLIERTEGNPFFLEESVRALVEAGVLAGAPGAYRLVQALPTIQVPAMVQAVLAARIDRLPAEAKHLLQTAAVIGTEVPLPLLQAMAELPEAALHHGLAHLQAAEFLYETRLFPDHEYTFKHALTHEVAYSSLLLERRRALHGRILEAIERLYPDRLAEQVERLAYHAFRGEMWEKAVRYLRQAGAKAVVRSANREAVACFDQALVALSHLPEARETLEEGVDVRFDLRTPLYLLGELQRVSDCLRDAEHVARRLDDQRRLGWVLSYTSVYFWQTGRPIKARTSGQSALAIGEALEDVPLQVAANVYLGAACISSGDYPAAGDFLRKALQLLEGDLSRERFHMAGFPAVLCRGSLALALAERGDFSQGIAYGEEGIRVAESLDHPYSVTVACWRLAYLYGRRGDFHHAVRLLERGLALAREWNLATMSLLMSGSLGFECVLEGRIAEGLPLLRQAVADHERVEVQTFYSLYLTHLGEAYVLAEQFEDASAVAGRTLTLTRERGERGYEAWALRLLGEIASHRDPPDIERAEANYRQALTLANELGMRPLVAHCHHGLGTLYTTIGQREQARTALTTAIEMYRAMEITFWLPQAETALAKVR